ncbi:MAG: hypothetical protein ACNA8W_03670 [Bradymonadaceae bacterium]
MWDRGPHEDNGAYGIYPVQSTDVLVENCVVRGASDAGIHVGHPEESILVYRMKSNDTEIKMPELPLQTIDEFGVELISDWIAAMEPVGCDL